MIKLGYITPDDSVIYPSDFPQPMRRAVIGNGEELHAEPRYCVAMGLDNRGKVVDVEYYKDYQAPEFSFHAMRAGEEVAIRYDRGDFDVRPAGLSIEMRQIFRQYA